MTTDDYGRWTRPWECAETHPRWYWSSVVLIGLLIGVPLGLVMAWA